jgi:hypothetical protein
MCVTKIRFQVTIYVGPIGDQTYENLRRYTRRNGARSTATSRLERWRENLAMSKIKCKLWALCEAGVMTLGNQYL